MLVIIYCFQLPPRHGQCIHQQLAAQWPSSGGSGLGEDVCCLAWSWRAHGGTAGLGASSPCGTCSLPNRTGSAVPIEDNFHSGFAVN